MNMLRTTLCLEDEARERKEKLKKDYTWEDLTLLGIATAEKEETEKAV